MSFITHVKLMDLLAQTLAVICRTRISEVNFNFLQSKKLLSTFELFFFMFYDDPGKDHKVYIVDNKVVLYTKSVAGVLTSSDIFPSSPCLLEESEIEPEIPTLYTKAEICLLSLDQLYTFLNTHCFKEVYEAARVQIADKSSDEEHPYLVFSNK